MEYYRLLTYNILPNHPVLSSLMWFYSFVGIASILYPEVLIVGKSFTFVSNRDISFLVVYLYICIYILGDISHNLFIGTSPWSWNVH